jgi:hypothetical protein
MFIISAADDHRVFRHTDKFREKDDALSANLRPARSNVADIPSRRWQTKLF